MRMILFEDRWRDGSPVGFVLSRAGMPFERHREPSEMVRAVLVHTPDAIVWVLRPDSAADLATLRLIRLIAPEVALIVVEAERAPLALDVRIELKPAFVGRLPADAAAFFATIDALRAVSTTL